MTSHKRNDRRARSDSIIFFLSVSPFELEEEHERLDSSDMYMRLGGVILKDHIII